MRLSSIFWVGSAVGVAGLLAVGIGLIGFLHRTSEDARILARLSEINQTSLAVPPLLIEVKLHRSMRALTQLHTILDDLDRLDLEFARNAQAVATAGEFKELSLTHDKLRASLQSIGTALSTDDPETDLSYPIEQIVVSAASYNDQIDRIATRQLNGMRDTLQTVATLSVFGGGAVGLICLIVFFFFRTRVFRPLEQLQTTLSEIGRGNLDLRAKQYAQDEIGDLVETVNGMTRSLKTVTAKKTDLEHEVGLREEAEQNLQSRNEALEESNEELNRFAYIASHDLRAPLQGIRSLTEWIAEDVENGETDELEENVRLIHSRVDRLQALLDSLLEFNRLGRTMANAEDVDIEAIVSNVAEMYVNGSGFDCTYEGPSLRLHTLRAPLELILRNLVGNAVKHHDREAGHIRIKGRVLDDVLEIAVQDDGPGVPRQMHERIFGMFATLKPRDDVEGSGMGLALIRKEARKYGSDVKIKSPVRDGRGTEFVFSWPLVWHEDGVHAAEGPSPADLLPAAQ